MGPSPRVSLTETQDDPPHEPELRLGLAQTREESPDARDHALLLGIRHPDLLIGDDLHARHWTHHRRVQHLQGYVPLCQIDRN